MLEWAGTPADEGLTAPGFPVEFGGLGDPGANVASFESLAFGDLSLLVKFGVQFGLWGGAIQRLGTRTAAPSAGREPPRPYASSAARSAWMSAAPKTNRFRVAT